MIKRIDLCKFEKECSLCFVIKCATYYGDSVVELLSRHREAMSSSPEATFRVKSKMYKWVVIAPSLKFGI
jgi:hypothetical protein